MKIETLTDWNAILEGCGCCQMPECPLPTRECESMEASASSAGFFDTSDAVWTIYRKKVVTENISISGGSDDLTDSGSANETFTDLYSNNFSGSIGDCHTWEAIFTQSCITSGSRTINSYYNGELLYKSEVTRTLISGNPCSWKDTFTNTDYDYDPPEVTSYETFEVSITTSYPNYGYGSYSYTSATTYELPATFSEWLQATVSSVSAEMTDWEECATGTACQSTASFSDEPAETGGSVSVALTKSRFRWVIPDTWEGSYFKITWDILEEPEGWDADPPTATRSFFLTDQTWTWAGPGDPEDADSWKSNWYEVAPPEAAGTRRLVNIRFECYQSAKFGVKPQVTGEAVELEDPA